MNGKGKIAGKGRAGARAPLALAAAALAAALVFTVSYAYARYATEYEVAAPVALFDVTSSITYVDEWGEAQAFDGYLGTMRPVDGEDDIYFLIAIENRGDVPVYCTITLSDGFMVQDCSIGYSDDNDDGRTITLSDIVEPGRTLEVQLTVNLNYTDESNVIDVRYVLLDMKLTYTQAGED